jgi:hypothetical protein
VIKAATGFPCPSCGLTRSGLAMGHGDWSAAFAWNPLGPLLVAEAFLVLLFLLARRARGVPLRPAQPLIDRWLAAHVFIFVGVWAARVATGWRG